MSGRTALSSAVSVVLPQTRKDAMAPTVVQQRTPPKPNPAVAVLAAARAKSGAARNVQGVSSFVANSQGVCSFDSGGVERWVAAQAQVVNEKVGATARNGFTSDESQTSSKPSKTVVVTKFPQDASQQRTVMDKMKGSGTVTNTYIVRSSGAVLVEYASHEEAAEAVKVTEHGVKVELSFMSIFGMQMFHSTAEEREQLEKERRDKTLKEFQEVQQRLREEELERNKMERQAAEDEDRERKRQEKEAEEKRKKDTIVIDDADEGGDEQVASGAGNVDAGEIEEQDAVTVPVIQKLQEKVAAIKAQEKKLFQETTLPQGGGAAPADGKGRTKWTSKARVTFYKHIRKANPWQPGVEVMKVFDNIAEYMREATAAQPQDGRVVSNGSTLYVYYRDQVTRYKNAMKGEAATSGNTGFVDSACEAAGCRTAEAIRECKEEWGELQKCIDLQAHYAQIATQLKEAKDQLKIANNGVITQMTMQTAATNKAVEVALWRRLEKDKKELDKKIITLQDAGRKYDLCDADKETLERYDAMKQGRKASTDDDELSSISHASKKGRTLVNCMQFISEQVSGMRTMLAQDTIAPAQSRPLTLLERLQELQNTKEAGFLTDEEYQTTKAHLLKRWSIGSP